MRIFFFIFFIMIGQAYALEDKTQVAYDNERQHNHQRITSFELTEEAYFQQRTQLQAEKAQLEAEIAELSTLFTENERNLADMEKSLQLETGSLGELFGVVRQAAKEFEAELTSSVAVIEAASDLAVLKEISAARTLPTIEQLTDMWQVMRRYINASGELKSFTVPIIDSAGTTSQQSVVRLGAIGLIGQEGYLNWSGSYGQYYPRQPKKAPYAAQFSVADVTHVIAIDPSRGDILSQLADTPTLKQRFDHAGPVGKIIVFLLIIGLGISVYRFIALTMIARKIRHQQKATTPKNDNALGRILLVFDAEKARTVEALELRLLEQVLDEQQGLEIGLSLIKLFAALAPMLGLLGTVTGMIETFQVITQFGHGDPTIMASGISMALMTTVLGLIAAMPLLFSHNILSTKVDTIKNILEKQGISLVAQQAESSVNNGPQTA
ncbi:MotA/TolQ/ExbB proton channel family protein [Thaumasiovibrio sp. DFM-14]|uniref:MotA/TolQ/ExbB proton channel family protein n=1 Tax=Thaumasiovibrio sp. DFM-14 TaxID=3384792 RepID=UPI0039A36EB5